MKRIRKFKKIRVIAERKDNSMSSEEEMDSNFWELLSSINSEYYSYFRDRELASSFLISSTNAAKVDLTSYASATIIVNKLLDPEP